MDGTPGTDDGLGSPVVVIVADHEDSAAMYAIFLLARGFLSVTARTAQDGFDRACAIRPDIVIVDMLLTDASGLELTRRLRSDTRTQDAGIIVVADHAVGPVRQEANEAGCDRFLLKPCLPDVLALEVVNLLRQRRGTAPDSPSVAVVGSVSRAIPTSDPKACPKCCGTLVFIAHPILSIGAIFERDGAQIDRRRYEGAWACRSGGCDYRELIGERIG